MSANFNRGKNNISKLSQVKAMDCAKMLVLFLFLCFSINWALRASDSMSFRTQIATHIACEKSSDISFCAHKNIANWYQDEKKTKFPNEFKQFYKCHTFVKRTHVCPYSKRALTASPRPSHSFLLRLYDAAEMRRNRSVYGILNKHRGSYTRNEFGSGGDTALLCTRNRNLSFRT